MTPDAAEIIAVRALGWIAGRDELSGAFLGASGASADELRARATDPEFLGFVLDFLLADEDALLAFCEDADTPPDAPMRARASLPGGDLPNWT
ncbi:MAG: DUF3572 domain-containing protein [Pseudomonadota bacterium]